VRAERDRERVDEVAQREEARKRVLLSALTDIAIAALDPRIKLAPR
jgi:hypothetical protein